jgi:hypothetical protein
VHKIATRNTARSQGFNTELTNLGRFSQSLGCMAAQSANLSTPMSSRYQAPPKSSHAAIHRQPQFARLISRPNYLWEKIEYIP